ncbi:hypothetical protein [Thalassococcus lentus]|uniref:Membrane transport protein MMPL domain-containing protein n=1 Tax=Thalassococcus lentus TaxID=1210524 RepID=A0ABT4XTV0_9RHOB|nr:hypothetical protein [Thalassococcus lentus]MDA7425381.1 hypothetical protein [Thalassococcus lentus]
MARRFRYKPALLQKAQDWTLDGTILHGPDGQTDLRAATGLRLAERRFRGQLLRRLDIELPDTTTRIALNISADTAPSDPDRAEHFALIHAVASTPAEHQPGLSVSIGEGDGARMAMFAIGVLAIVFGLGIPIAALMTGVSPDRMIEASVPILALSGFGIWVALTNAPWRARPSLPASALPALLDSLEA